MLFDDDRRFLFAARYDTTFDKYVEEAVEIVTPARWYSFLQYCEEVPQGRGEDNPLTAEEIKDLLQANQVRADRYFRAYPQGTLSEILNAQRVYKGSRRCWTIPLRPRRSATRHQRSPTSRLGGVPVMWVRRCRPRSG